MADRWAQFLDHLAGALDAGLPPGSAVALAGEAAGGPLAAAAPDWAAAVDRGESLAGAITGADPLITAILTAGERSGRLPELCRLLARQRAQMARLRWQALGRLAYPLLLAHMAVFMPAVVAVFAGASPWWLAAGPAVLWSLIGGAWVLWRWDQGRSGWWLRGPAGLVWWPLITARSAAALAAGAAAGLLADGIVDLVAGACGHPTVAQRLRDQTARLRSGQGRIADTLRAAGYPAWAVDPLTSAETAGRLEAAAVQVGAEAAFRFEERSTWAMRLITGAIYALAMLMAVAAILTIAAGYARMLTDIAREAGG
jgi:type II secretory pathway component PulF